VPYVFPTDGLLHGLPLRDPTAVHARAGRYCYDTMTLVGPGTWEAAVGAVDATLGAVDIAVGGAHGTPLTAGASGATIGYAIARPPGHHAAYAAFGGSCYLNNAAVAAVAMRDRGAARVAVIDIDAHHGNGTQALFYDRGDVLYGSVHVDPGAGWFPHYLGFADEQGRGEGDGANVNRPLAPGTGDDGWLEAVDQLASAVWAFGADALVVSLGVDAAAADPESPLQVTEDGYAAAGRVLGALGLPTVAVQEGGYHLPTIGPLVVATLRGLASSDS
jgi:acetoin utilization deacetylase AcuC-like enzyme